MGVYEDIKTFKKVMGEKREESEIKAVKYFETHIKEPFYFDCKNGILYLRKELYNEFKGLIKEGGLNKQ